LTATIRPTPEALRARWEQATAAPDPLAALGASHGFEEQWEQWQRGMVADAVEAGATWEQIGLALGISRQAAWARFRNGTEGVGVEFRSMERLVQARLELKAKMRGLIELKKQRDAAWRKERSEALERVKAIDRQHDEEQAALFQDLRGLVGKSKSLIVVTKRGPLKC
jgi:hypothetical protein